MVDAFVYAALRVISLASERKKKKKRNGKRELLLFTVYLRP